MTRGPTFHLTARSKTEEGSMRRAIALRWPARVLLGAALAMAMLGGGALARGDDGGEAVQPVEFAHNVNNAPAPVTSAIFGSGPPTKSGQALCTTPTQAPPNVNTDCEGVNPHNETSIAVNPTN